MKIKLIVNNTKLLSNNNLRNNQNYIIGKHLISEKFKRTYDNVIDDYEKLYLEKIYYVLFLLFALSWFILDFFIWWVWVELYYIWMLIISIWIAFNKFKNIIFVSRRLKIYSILLINPIKNKEIIYKKNYNETE